MESPFVPGVYPGMPESDYFALDAVSNSDLGLIARSPAHYLWGKAHPTAQTPAQRLGTAVHAAVLEPDTFTARYAKLPDVDKRTKDGKAVLLEWMDANVGAKGLTADEWDAVCGMANSITEHFAASSLLSLPDSRTELSLLWNSEKGTPCRARIDSASFDCPNVIIDLKTTLDASPKGFGKSVANFQYHRQAGWYTEGWRVLTGVEPTFVFIAVEKNPPYAVGAYQVDANDIMAGRQRANELLAIYEKCREKDSWYAYSSDVEPLFIPKWGFEEVQDGAL